AAVQRAGIETRGPRERRLFALVALLLGVTTVAQGPDLAFAVVVALLVEACLQPQLVHFGSLQVDAGAEVVVVVAHRTAGHPRHDFPAIEIDIADVGGATTERAAPDGEADQVAAQRP